MKKDSRKCEGWNFRTLENKWIKLHLAPNLGGRIIQFEMDGYEFFFNNPYLLGKEPDQTRLRKNGIWLNFGGEKIWPAPQGWNSPDQWPGPPDPVIDSGAYSIAEFTDDAEENTLTMTSLFDQYTGLQIKKEVILAESRSEVTVHATFCNKSDVLKKWSIWPVLQMNTYDTGVENQYRIVCPVNPESKFSNGYKVMHGLVNNPQYQINADGNVVIYYQYLVGKIGLDTDSNWTAFIDTKSGKVFVLKFQYQEDKPYPEDTCFQVWTSGKGIVYSRNMIKEYKDDKELNPPYMEMELLSPLQTIQPGESIQFEYRMLTCTIPENVEVRSVNQFGVIASPLQLVTEGDEFTISGKYGIFREGFLKLQLNDVTINEIESFIDLYSEKASPLDGIDIEFKMKKEKGLFDQEAFISINLYDLDNCLVGKIDKLKLNKLK
jgi:hypothetical protein